MCYTINGKYITSYNTLSRAAASWKVSEKTIKKCINGKCNLAGGARWKYFYGDTCNIQPLD